MTSLRLQRETQRQQAPAQRDQRRLVSVLLELRNGFEEVFGGFVHHGTPVRFDGPQSLFFVAFRNGTTSQSEVAAS